jgi:flagellar protein FlbD
VIRVTRLDGHEFYLNPELLEWFEATPDTVISLTTGCKLVVRESPEVLVERVLEYRRLIACRLAALTAGRE